jgi:hypothetical protein
VAIPTWIEGAQKNLDDSIHFAQFVRVYLAVLFAAKGNEDRSETGTKGADHSYLMGDYKFDK